MTRSLILGQFDRDKAIIDFDDKLHALDFPIIAIVIRNLLCPMRSECMLQLCKNAAIRHQEDAAAGLARKRPPPKRGTT